MAELNPPQGGCEIEQPAGYYCSRDFHHNGSCACHPLPEAKTRMIPNKIVPSKPRTEHSGGPVSYYLVHVDKPNQGAVAYTAECGDIIEALQMTFPEGCEFKAIWRTAAARFGRLKHGGDPIYDADKRIFYAQRSRASYTETGEYMEAKRVDMSDLKMYNGAPLFGVLQEVGAAAGKFYLGGVETTKDVFDSFMHALPKNHPQQFYGQERERRDIHQP